MTKTMTNGRKPAGPKNVLMLGFSVLGHHFYRSLMAIRHRDFSVDVFALGGHNYSIFPAILDRILARDHYDLVLLDMLTPDFRAWVKLEAFEAHLRTLLFKISQQGMKVGFLHLHRFDVDPLSDPIRAICDSFSNQYDLPVLDFARWHVPALGNEIQRYLNDGVHFTELGARWAADIVVQSLEAPGVLGKSAALPELQPAGALMRHCAYSFAELGLVAPTETFTGYGVRWPVSVIAEEQPVTVAMPGQFFGTGVFFVNGPLSGLVDIDLPGGAPVALQIHDAKSYFERMYWRPVAIGKAAAVGFRQRAGRPGVVLDKGTPNLGRRKLTLALVTGIAVPKHT